MRPRSHFFSLLADQQYVPLTLKDNEIFRQDGDGETAVIGDIFELTFQFPMVHVCTRNWHHPAHEYLQLGHGHSDTTKLFTF